MCECPLCTYKDALGSITIAALNAGATMEELIEAVDAVGDGLTASIQADENRTGCEALH